MKKATYDGEVTVFVYDAAGRAVAEYSNLIRPRYLTQDILGRHQGRVYLSHIKFNVFL